MNVPLFPVTDRTARKRASFGALDAKQPGSIDWAWHVLEVLKLRWQRVESDHEQFESLLSEAETHHIWDVVPPGNPYGSRAAMLRAELGVDEDLVRATVQEVKLRDRRGPPPIQERANDSNGIIRPRGGNNGAYTMARLKRDRPDLAARVEAGALSANAAAIEAGWRVRTVTVSLTVPGAVKLLGQLTPDERAEVARSMGWQA